MKKKFGKFMLGLFGWSIDETMPPDMKRCVLIAAPHTSNWDFVYAAWAMLALGVPYRFAIKDNWTKSPIGFLFKAFGAIGVNRGPKVKGQERKGMVDAMAELFEQQEELALIITPEGSRSLRKQWKLGFYHVAIKAQVPIIIGIADFKTRHISFVHTIHPSGDLDKDLSTIMTYYKDAEGLVKEDFSLDERFLGDLKP